MKFLFLTLLAISSFAKAETNAICDEPNRNDCSFGRMSDPAVIQPDAIADCLLNEKDIVCVDSKDKIEYENMTMECMIEGAKFSFQPLSELDKPDGATSLYYMGCLIKQVRINSYSTCGCDL